MASSRRILPVIMSGGSGSRLWPVSTEAYPKQFHALASTLSMIQETARRFEDPEQLSFLPALVICNAQHAKLARDQLTEAGLPPAGVILEPFGRNTAAVAVIAALWAAEHAPDALVLLLPADHVVKDVIEFRHIIEHAKEAAADNIVTLGIEPHQPETGYGYIQRGDVLYEGAFRVKQFVEKPDRKRAEAYLREGGYYWNAGIFLFQPWLLLREVERYCASVLEATADALEGAERDGPFIALNADKFAKCPSLPIDIAVMEKTQHGVVVPCSIGWADVGTWSELWRQGPLDGEQNLTRGEVVAIDTKDSVFWSTGPKIAVFGVTGLIVVATNNHVLIVPKDQAQDVKRLVDKLKEATSR